MEIIIMAFNFKNFLLDMAELAPAIVGAVGNLRSEVSSVTKTQLAYDSLHVLTGISTALLSSDPAEAQMAQAASSIVGSSIAALATFNTLPTVKAQAPAPAVTTDQPVDGGVAVGK
jgi:hypothetical protein